MLDWVGRKFLVVFAAMLIIATIGSHVSWADNGGGSAALRVIVPKGDLDLYRKLADSIGLKYDAVYGYRDFAEIARRRGIGEAGHYELLMTSAGGVDIEQQLEVVKRPVYWETYYYDNINMTIIRQVENKGQRSYVRLLKLAKGRVPDLHLNMKRKPAHVPAPKKAAAGKWR